MNMRNSNTTNDLAPAGGPATKSLRNCLPNPAPDPSTRSLRLRRRATVVTQAVVFGSLVGVGLAAITVDTGLMFASKQELQNAADAAALAAASQLGGTENATDAALAEAATFAAANNIQGDPGQMLSTDLVLGHAVLNVNTGKYDFLPEQMPRDAVKITLRRDDQVIAGPISLVFGRLLGVDEALMTASAVAMVVPRDMALVVDLSGSMNDDSELRHYKQYPSESGGTRPGVQINLKDVWSSLPLTRGYNGIGHGSNPAAPTPATGGNSQPGTGNGTPSAAGGNPDNGPDTGTTPRGPRWAWMTGWGSNIILGAYTPVADPGLYYIPRSATTSNSDVAANLTEAGYNSAERTALLSGTYDSSTTEYRNRVKVLLGVAGWKSGKSGAKYSSGGNGDNHIESSELTQEIPFPYASGGSWSGYVDYMTNSSEMRNTDPNFRYRYGLKTVVNYFLENMANHSKCPDLAAAPEMPMSVVKSAVRTLIDTIVDLDTQDHVSLEVFATTGRHEVNLSQPGAGQTLEEVLQAVPDTLDERQAGHYDSTTNAGAGLDKAITELTSPRARDSAAKVIIFLSDGKPNVDQYNNYVGNGAPAAVNWGLDRATTAADLGMTVYTIGVGGDANDGFLQQIADIGHGQYFFADNSPDPITGQPMYVQQLATIFETLGGKRPVRLIQ
jgi:hypothetical protein